MLVPCPSCSRHVRAADASCPFCDHELPVNLAAKAIPGTARRLSRAAFFTFATAVGAISAVAVGCGGDDVDTQSDTGGDGSSPDGDFGGVDAAYGGPVFDANKPDAPFGLDSGIDATDDGSIIDASDDGG